MAEVTRNDAIAISARHVRGAVETTHWRECIRYVRIDGNWRVVVHPHRGERSEPVLAPINTQLQEYVKEAPDHVAAVDGADNVLARGSQGRAFPQHRPGREVPT